MDKYQERYYNEVLSKAFHAVGDYLSEHPYGATQSEDGKSLAIFEKANPEHRIEGLNFRQVHSILEILHPDWEYM